MKLKNKRRKQIIVGSGKIYIGLYGVSFQEQIISPLVVDQVDKAKEYEIVLREI